MLFYLFEYTTQQIDRMLNTEPKPNSREIRPKAAPDIIPLLRLNKPFFFVFAPLVVQSNFLHWFPIQPDEVRTSLKLQNITRRGEKKKRGSRVKRSRYKSLICDGNTTHQLFHKIFQAENPINHRILSIFMGRLHRWIDLFLSSASLTVVDDGAKLEREREEVCAYAVRGRWQVPWEATETLCLSIVYWKTKGAEGKRHLRSH